MAKQQLICIVIGVFLQLGDNRANDYQCGTADIIVPRISGGHSTIRGEWPFLAALYHVEKMKFFCGGTLISRNHVLTAAHCLHWKYTPQETDPEDIIVVLGGYNLLSSVEKGSVHKEVNEIHVHSGWKVYSAKYDADIAILTLRGSVTFTYFIRPVCLPTDDVAVEDIRGAIVGWGLDDNGTMHLEYPKHASTIVRNQSYCLTIDPELAHLSSTRTFCANGGDGVPQPGDSGGGFFSLSGSSWVQYGIISALRLNATGIFDLSSFAIYTNVKLFKHWIGDIVARTQDEVKTLDDDKTELFCRYSIFAELGYTCRVISFDIRSENFKVTSITGAHLSGKTDSDVNSIFFYEGTLNYLPNGIGNIFRNLKSIVISYNLGLTAIKPSTLYGMDNLVSLVVQTNDMTNFEVNALWSLKNLEKLDIRANQLTVVDQKLLDKNRKLTEINLNRNEIEVLHEKALLYLTNLRKFSISLNKIQTIGARTFEENPQLIEIDLSYNNIEKFDPTTLRNLQNLEKFHVNNNRLPYLDDDFFEMNGNLKNVNVANNQLVTLDEQLFMHNLLLEEADFGSNQLEIVRTDFTKLKNVQQLNFYGNVCVRNRLDEPKEEDLAQFQSFLRKNCTKSLSNCTLDFEICVRQDRF